MKGGTGANFRGEGPHKHMALPSYLTAHIVDFHRKWPELYRERRPWAITVGGRVRRLRTERGWRLDELSQAVVRPDGRIYSTTTLSRLERGSAGSPFYVYLQVAQALEIEPGRLLGTDSALLQASEAEMTLVRALRQLAIEPHEALALLLQARATEMRSSSPSTWVASPPPS